MPIIAALDGAGRYRQHSYFFGPTAYRRYNWSSDTLDDGGSLPLFAFHLPAAFRANVDAALCGSGRFGDKAYFFKGDQYVRYSWTANRVDFGPAPVATWHLPAPFANGLDAALNGGGQYAGKAYFFKGAEYARYDWATDTVDLVGPLGAWGFPAGFASAGLDAAVNGWSPYSGKAYFFSGERYVRYDWNRGQGAADEGYPLTIQDAWPALHGMAEPANRRLLLYVTIDPTDQRKPSGDWQFNHGPNFNRLQELATAWQANLLTDDFWCADVDALVANDHHVLALFLAGSFTEWVEAFRQPSWSARLNQFEALLRQIRVPILGVCGSHQLVAQMFGGWEALGHMAATGSTPVQVSAEKDQVFRAPNPRTGEAGIYAFHASVSDPLLAGLPQPAFFVTWHHDEVLQDVPAAHATVILQPDGLTNAIQADAYAMDPCIVKPGEPPVRYTHRPLASPGERASCQAFRYQVNPPGRLLYTTQFHPELLSDVAQPQAAVAAAHGGTLIRNFLGCAANYWRDTQPQQ